MVNKVEKGQIFKAMDSPYFKWRVAEIYSAEKGIPINCKLVRVDDQYSVKTLSAYALSDSNLFTPIATKDPERPLEN